MTPSDRQHQDSLFMKQAIELAYRGYGTTSPNPPVGAVIVQSGIVIGQGFHARAGEPHAERMALADARARGNEALLKGATIYVTLEPCSTVGRTPACTDGIIEAGIARVVYGAVDPDPRHRGRADALLRAAGVEVCPGAESAACGLLLRSWAYAVQHHRPWVTAKVATTLDGRLSRRSERWLSTPESLRWAHERRLRSDAILIGGETLRRDDPSLTVRNPISSIPEKKIQPLRLVLTHRAADLPRDRKLFTDEHRDRTLVYEQLGDFDAFLRELYEKHGVVNLMLECGGKLLRTFLEKGLVNAWQQEIIPVLAGGPEELVTGDFLPEERQLQVESVQQIGHHLLLNGILT